MEKTNLNLRHQEKPVYSTPPFIKHGGDIMEFKKILWPTDFSRIAEKALPHVKSLTEKYNAEIHVLYVIEDIAHHEPWYGEFGKNHTNKIIEHGRKLAKRRLELLVTR